MLKLSLTIQDLEVRISGDTAIVTYSGELNVTGHQDARYNVSNAKLTAADTWHRQSGEWILLEKMVFTVLGAVAELITLGVGRQPNKNFCNAFLARTRFSTYSCRALSMAVRIYLQQ